MDLLTVGEAFEDIVFTGLPHLPRLSEELRVHSMSQHPGGGAIITAVAAARLGLAVGTITALGPRTEAALRRERLQLVNLQRPGEDAAVTVALSTARDRAFVTYEGVNRVLEARLLDALQRTRRAPRHVHFAMAPRHCSRWVAVVERFRRRRVSTSWDFGWHAALRHDRGFRRLLGLVDWVFVNEREATFYTQTKDIDRALAVWSARARGAVIKLGPRGVVVVTGRERLDVPTRKARVVDTTGAGDSFNAGFLAALLAGQPVGEAARLGNLVGGRSVGAAGGIDGLPRRAKLPGWARRTLKAV